ncbi:hypothetical protein QJS04_geneDACA015914 [Acorus gramineus]|uniref:Uncharacterized protein n=1 Tax=Acorus gramineus TaxID=55184 RepID=A0AAV9BNJ8_ACOGR|nr:hypothetical protein QJS04_geneDACA015914 [Acorus gramineus]
MSYTENYVMNIITYDQNIKLRAILEKVVEHYGPIKSDVNSVIHFAKDPKKKSFANRMAMNAKNEAVISVNEAKKLPGELAPPDVVSLHEYLVKLIVVIGMVTNDLH